MYKDWVGSLFFFSQNSYKLHITKLTAEIQHILGGNSVVLSHANKDKNKVSEPITLATYVIA